MILLALYVPDRMDMIPLYIDRKHDGYPTWQKSTGEEKYLGETCGIIVFQEQLRLLTFRTFGISQFEISPLINATKEKNQEQLSVLREQYIKTARGRGYSDEHFEMIWECWSKYNGSIPH